VNVRVLLDTHLLLWALSQPGKLSAVTRKQIEDAEVFVSAASIWEIAIKFSLGRLTYQPGQILAAIEPAGFRLLFISGEHAAKVADLPPLHKDPFDRLLIAQAQSEPLLLLTNDEALRGYGAHVSVGN
jgi:PIN domain nuclease of toxin-antitoxin system